MGMRPDLVTAPFLAAADMMDVRCEVGIKTNKRPVVCRRVTKHHLSTLKVHRIPDPAGQRSGPSFNSIATSGIVLKVRLWVPREGWPEVYGNGNTALHYFVLVATPHFLFPTTWIKSGKK